MTTPAELNKILFEQLSRITTASKSELESVIQQTKAVEAISEQVIKNNQTVLDAVKLKAHYKGMEGEEKAQLPQAFIGC